MTDPDAKPTHGVVFRHYTDDAGREGIERTGMISPGADGCVYFTEDTYDRALEAQAKLSLPRCPVGYFEVRAGAISDPGVRERVLPDYGQPGGGTQISITGRIEAEGLVWVALEQ